MKKSLILAKSVMMTMGMVGAAHASTETWTGFYVGMDVGVAFNNVHLSSQQLGFTNPNATCNKRVDYSNFFSGIQLGYMHQFTNAFVAGVEVNPSINTHQKHTLSCESEFNPAVDDSFRLRNQLQTSIKGRVGHTMNWRESTFLPYLVVGPSFANLGLTYHNEGGDHYANTATQVGWLIGAGVEWAFTQHWSLRAEYNFTDYGNAIDVNIPTIYGLFDPNGNAQANLQFNNLILAINYWIH